jgi:ATP-binding protein involved in chromosome partitioning
MKSYHDIVGDGGSRVLEQVAEQRTRINDGLAGVRHLVAVGSGKGGVGKSTLTLHLAGALRARGLRIAILDADFNGPSQARMAGVQEVVFVPPSPTGFGAGTPPAAAGFGAGTPPAAGGFGAGTPPAAGGFGAGTPPAAGGFGAASGGSRLALPRTRNGIGVFSMGSLIPEWQALEFESAAHGASHTWRATREFALLGEVLASFEWGALDLLLFDLPPGAERTVQYAEFLSPFGAASSSASPGLTRSLSNGGSRTSFLLVTIPSEVSRGVVARSVAALSKGANQILGYVENMSGYYCHDCNAIKPLFVSSGASPLKIPCLGTVPFDPELARHCDRGLPLAELPETPVGAALNHVAQQLLNSLESTTPGPAHASPDRRPEQEPSR